MHDVLCLSFMYFCIFSQMTFHQCVPPISCAVISIPESHRAPNHCKWSMRRDSSSRIAYRAAETDSVMSDEVVGDRVLRWYCRTRAGEEKVAMSYQRGRSEGLAAEAEVATAHGGEIVCCVAFAGLAEVWAMSWISTTITWSNFCGVEKKRSKRAS